MMMPTNENEMVRRTKNHGDQSFADSLEEAFARCSTSSEGEHMRYRKSVQASFTTLKVCGYQIRNAFRLSGVHVDALMSHWAGAQISQPTISMRLYALRWFACGIGKPGLVNPEMTTTADRTAVVRRARRAVDGVVITKDELASWDTFEYLSWALLSTGIKTREECLRLRAVDIANLQWPTLERKGDTPGIQSISEDSSMIAAAAIKHIVARHGRMEAALGWGGFYKREDCPAIARDLLRWRRVAKRRSVAKKDQ
jgi:hypothetical protein